MSHSFFGGHRFFRVRSRGVVIRVINKKYPNRCAAQKASVNEFWGFFSVTYVQYVKGDFVLRQKFSQNYVLSDICHFSLLFALGPCALYYLVSLSWPHHSEWLTRRLSPRNSVLYDFLGRSSVKQRLRT